jgi:drug/metabolite transporter (DMT)-like permease
MSTSTPIPHAAVPPLRSRAETLGWLALAGSLVAISGSPLFVRFADVGPIASAFWRMLIALPVLYAWVRLQGGSNASPVRGAWGMPALAGAAFAADLAFFHLSLEHTSIANASFIGNLATVFAVIGGALVLGERASSRVWAALGIALAGAWIMGGAAADLTAFNAGDALALGAALAYAAYLLAIKRGRAAISSADLMLRSSLVCALLLLAGALATGERIVPASAAGWLPLLGLGLVSHALGQSLTAVALGRLPVAPLAVAAMSQPILSAGLAWLIMGEGIGALQVAGAALILTAIAFARGR